MAKEKDEQPARRRTIPIYGPEYQWWTDAVKRRLTELKIEQIDLANYIAAKPPEVSRCISRKKPVYELLMDISDALRIPYPVILPETYEEAEELARQRRLVRRDAQVSQIKAGVGDRRENGQIQAITLVDVSQWKSKPDAKEKHQDKSTRARASR